MVLGMHRSGTSALTRTLSLLGAGLPARLIGADTNNQLGYWEPARLNALHNQMLAEAGSCWDDWRVFEIAELSRSRGQFYRAEIARLLDEEYGVAPLVVLKDPRISRFVPLYAEILKAMKVDVRYVLTMRNPLAVIGSLGKRDGFTPGFAALLWLRHQLEAEHATRGKPRVFVSYEDLVREWRPRIEKVTEALSIIWPRGLNEVAAEIDAFFSGNHQHHVASDGQLFADERIAGWVKEAYAALKALETDPLHPEATAALDRVKSEFDAVSPIFGEAFFSEFAARQRNLAKRLAEEHAIETARFAAEIEEKDMETAHYKTRLEREQEVFHSRMKKLAAKLALHDQDI